MQGEVWCVSQTHQSQTAPSPLADGAVAVKQQLQHMGKAGAGAPPPPPLVNLNIHLIILIPHHSLKVHIHRLILLDCPSHHPPSSPRQQPDIHRILLRVHHRSSSSKVCLRIRLRKQNQEISAQGSILSISAWSSANDLIISKLHPEHNLANVVACPGPLGQVIRCILIDPQMGWGTSVSVTPDSAESDMTNLKIHIADISI
ncbi:hypothetical protein Tco_0194537 [Tanacetum coccineum]